MLYAEFVHKNKLKVDFFITGLSSYERKIFNLFSAFCAIIVTSDSTVKTKSKFEIVVINYNYKLYITIPRKT